MKIFIGIDNGVTGGVTILDENGKILWHSKTPVKKHLNYTKKKAFVNRVDPTAMKAILKIADASDGLCDSFCMIERPMVNPTRFTATISAIRCLEATETLLELLQIPYQFIDSKEWQKILLPSGLKGDELKVASESVALRLFPKVKVLNSDCLLIAEYCKRMNQDVKRIK